MSEPNQPEDRPQATPDTRWTAIWKKLNGILTWKSLDGVSHIQFLKVSYLVLTVVPFVALIQYEFTSLPLQLRHMPPIIRLLYFSSLFLSLAHMMYQGWCPPIIKRFDSPNDLYRALLEIKALQVQYLPTDAKFDFHIEHCRANFITSNLEHTFARIVCGILYMAGGLLFLIVVALQALRLFGVFWAL